MNYLKKYNITSEQIVMIKEKYNDGIINFLIENKEFVKQTIEYLISEGFILLFEMLNNNIKIFLETRLALEKKIKKMKQKELSTKEIQIVLINPRVI